MQKYLDWLRETIVKQDEALRRATLYCYLSIAIFELLVLTPKSELTFGPLKVADSSGLLFFFPTAVAYFCLEVFMGTGAFDDYRDAFARLLEKWHAGVTAKRIEQGAFPPQTLYYGSMYDAFSSSAVSREESTRETLSGGFGLIVPLLAPLAFQVQAFIVLFARSGSDRPLLWANLAATGLLYVFIARFLWLDLRE
ncbi:hypothetical protein ACQPX6_00350 [Actinomycetospora sp. CA-101289]|uniref:hypothetical protein n=1 Tax=Actinomycetospora sp. CA-101289 TaxID=3239893 RepID=UPI003D95D873